MSHYITLHVFPPVAKEKYVSYCELHRIWAWMLILFHVLWPRISAIADPLLSRDSLWKSEGQKDGILDNRQEVNKKSVLTLNMLLFWSSCCSYVDIDQRQSEGTIMGYSRKKSACVPPALHVPWWLNKKYAMLPDSIRHSCSPRGRTEKQCCIIASYLSCIYTSMHAARSCSELVKVSACDVLLAILWAYECVQTSWNHTFLYEVVGAAVHLLLMCRLQQFFDLFQQGGKIPWRVTVSLQRLSSKD